MAINFKSPFSAYDMRGQRYVIIQRGEALSTEAGTVVTRLAPGEYRIESSPPVCVFSAGVEVEA
jgi:hypothetical protein